MSMRPLIPLIAGFCVWAGAFLLLYAQQATGCRLGWDGVMIGPLSLLRVLLIIELGLAIVLGVVVLRWFRPSPENSTALERIVWLANGAAIAAAFCFVGVFWLTLC